MFHESKYIARVSLRMLAVPRYSIARSGAPTAIILLLLSASGPLVFAAEPTASSQPSSITSVGIYNCYTGMPPADIPFFKACGYNVYQRWDVAWMRRPSHQELYYSETAEDIRRMQKAGFKVSVLLSINMRQCREGDAEGYRDNGFDPADETLMRERLANLATTIQKLKMADGFAICAGDPGGNPNAEPAQYVEAVKKIIAVIAQEAPRAQINVNPWSIASWDHLPSPFVLDFWEKELHLTQNLISRTDVLGPNVGIEFPMHNYYRPLVFKCYADAGKQPELCPTSQEVRSLQQRGVKRLWAWPYFLTDTCDDGHDPKTAGLAQSETRYIKQTVDNARRLGLNGMIANAMEANIFAESLNLYAFARLCKDPKATPEQVIDEFAGFLSETETAGAMATVLRYIENHSTWQAGMPERHRLPNFDTGTLKTHQDALELLAKVRLRRESTLLMAKPPAEYVQKLKERLEMLAGKTN